MIGVGWQAAPATELAMTYESLLALDDKIEKVGLTPEEIKKLKTVVLAEADCQDSSCPICLDNFQVGKKAKRLPCKHDFHIPCISKWFKDHVMCPLCRYDCHKMQAAK